MADYKEMYLKMVREAEKVIDILITVQQECEQQYIEATEPNLVLIDKMLTKEFKIDQDSKASESSSKE